MNLATFFDSTWTWVCIGLGLFFFITFFYKGLVTRHRAKHPSRLANDKPIETDPERIALADPYTAKPAAPTPEFNAATVAKPETVKAVTPDISTSYSAFHRAFITPGANGVHSATPANPDNPYQWA